MNQALRRAINWISRYSGYFVGAVVASATVLLGLYLLVPIVVSHWNDMSAVSQIACVVLIGAIVATTSHFIHVFTRNLPKKGDYDDLPHQLKAIFVYAYAFQSVAIALSLLPFVFASDIAPFSKGSWAGVEYGCLRAEGAYGSGLIRCGDDGHADQQWLVHVGSRRVNPILVTEDILSKLSDRANAACEKVDRTTVLYGIVGHIVNTSNVTPLVADIENICNEDAENRSINIKQALQEGSVLEGVRIELSRGLVVPLYVVVLAIIGAAVGMTRRLPEIQKRAAKSYTANGNGQEKALSSIEAREKVVFQIMQVLAAPLIAVAAFAIFEPDSLTAGALIGFGSGFASEAILKKIRQASQTIAP